MRSEDNIHVKKMHFQRLLSMMYSLLFLVMFCLSGCGLGADSNSPVNKASESILVKPENRTVAIGMTQPFTLVSSYSGDVSSSAVWSSLTSSVATVSSDGMVTAIAPGETKILATTGGNTYSTTLTVKPSVFADISGVHASPTGIWDGTYTIYEAIDTKEIGTYTFKLNLDQSGTNVSGTSSLRYDIVGQKADGTLIEGNSNYSVMNFIFKYVDPRSSYEMVNIGSAVITGTTMTGEVVENFKNGWNCSYRFTATKQ